MDKPTGVAERIIKNIETVIIGKRHVIQQALAALICRGHILFEDVPGVGKTMLARALSLSLGLQFRRIQFTPDVLPSDVTGVSVFNQKNGEFEFKPGPVVTNLLLADEINRATPRTQSALLECMEERQLTVDGRSLILPKPFMVIATQNPLEYEGTFPLPEAQLDRFFIRLALGYPSIEEEAGLLVRLGGIHPIHTVSQVADRECMDQLADYAERVFVHEELRHYIIRVVTMTRQHPDVALGSSPRGSLALYRAAQAVAMLGGRDFAIPDDIKAMAVPVLAHRLLLRPESQVRGVRTEDILHGILTQVVVPSEDWHHA